MEFVRRRLINGRLGALALCFLMIQIFAVATPVAAGDQTTGAICATLSAASDSSPATPSHSQHHRFCSMMSCEAMNAIFVLAYVAAVTDLPVATGASPFRISDFIPARIGDSQYFLARAPPRAA